MTKLEAPSEPEDGECSESSKSDTKIEVETEAKPLVYEPTTGDMTSLGGRASAIRAIVTRCRLSSGLLYLSPYFSLLLGQQTGDLHLITIDGYTIGSDPSNDLILKDTSSFVAWITYDVKSGDFMLHPSEKLGIISYENSEYYFETEEPLKICHGMSIEIGYNIIELHLHPPSQLGQSETCDGCEPGLRKAEILRQSRLNQDPKEVVRQRIHKQLKPSNHGNSEQKSMYRDRATERRDKIGSDNPYIRDDKPADVNTEIGKSNIGRKMLEKSGWKSGQGLGKRGQGITVPIQASHSRSKGDSSGIGTNQSRVDRIKLKTIKRYNALQ